MLPQLKIHLKLKNTLVRDVRISSKSKGMIDTKFRRKVTPGVGMEGQRIQGASKLQVMFHCIRRVVGSSY